MAKNPKQPPGDKPKRVTAKLVQSTEGLPPPAPPIVGMPPPPPAVPEPDDAPWDDEGLTFKQRAFCIAYVGPAAGNATKAAQMAGYRDDNYDSLKVTACENLTKPNVARCIARLVAGKLGGPEWTRAGITEIANANMADFVKVADNGQLVLDGDKAQQAAALGLVQVWHEKVIESESGPTVIDRKLKLYSRLDALKTLAKMNGQIVDRHVVNGTISVTHKVMPNVLKDPEAFAAARLLTRRTSELRNQENGDPIALPPANGNGKH
jgi:hypothetical protein